MVEVWFAWILKQQNIDNCSKSAHNYEDCLFALGKQNHGTKLDTHNKNIFALDQLN